MNYCDNSFTTHQPRTVYDSGNGTMNHFWDANGNLAQIVDCKHNAARLHEWDEENRLRFVLGEKYAGYYGYDANGERVYKLTGSSSMDDVNAGSIKAQAIFDDAVLYPNPYIVVTPKGYTKHYYAGTERLATAIGGGGFLHMQTPIVPLTSQHDMDIVKSFYEYYQDEDPFNYQQIINKSEPTEDIWGNEKPDLEYQCQPTKLVLVDVYTSQDILLGSISTNQQVFSEEDDVYFYHGDHLGSANWITDADSNPIQYIHYAPYGEQIANQTPYGYDERFKFTGKERDWETGYDYFGARFYDHRKGIWNSVDPLADKYPNVTPYLYCNGNPIMLVDPDGREHAHVFPFRNTYQELVNNGKITVNERDNIMARNQRLDYGASLRSAIDLQRVSEYFVHGSRFSILGRFGTCFSVETIKRNILVQCQISFKNNRDVKNTLIVLYSCKTGRLTDKNGKIDGKGCIAQEISADADISGAIVFAPSDNVSIDCKTGEEYVENGGHWNVFCKGRCVGQVSGERGALTAELKRRSIDETIKYYRNKTE